MRWINEIIMGIKETFDELNLYEIIDTLEIEIIDRKSVV